MLEANPRYILIIDDNPVDRMAHRGMLSRATEPSFVFLEADSGETGLSLYRQEQPDCVLLDYNLPDCDAVEFLETLQKQYGKDEPLPIIVFSGDEDIDGRLFAQTKRCGAQRYLVKGQVSFDILFYAILNTIEKVSLYRQLRRQNKEFAQLLSATTHKLRGSLSKVISYNQLLQHRYSENLDKKGNTYLEEALKGADEVTQITEQLRQYSHIDFTQKTFGLTSLAHVLSNTRHEHKDLLEKDAVSFTYSDDLPSVYGSESTLHLLFAELLKNALEFRGDKALCISVVGEVKDGFVQISFEDNGLGLEEKEQEKLFQAFHTASTNHKKIKLGMRMFVCKKILEQHGGELLLQSKPGEGSTFSFRLPLHF